MKRELMEKKVETSQTTPRSGTRNGFGMVSGSVMKWR